MNEWIVHTPRKSKGIHIAKNESAVYAAFQKKYKDKLYLRISITCALAETVGWKAGDTIKFMFSKDNKRVWLLKKSDDDIGYTLSKVKNGSRLFCTFSFMHCDIISEDEHTTKKVLHDIHLGGLRIEI